MKMIRLTVILTLLVAVFVCPSLVHAESVDLLSMDEAKDLSLSDEEWAEGAIPKSLGSTIGPKIIFEKPTVEDTDNGLVITAPSEMNLLVEFKDGISQVDMKTLAIRARKGWFSKNLTDRLAPYLDGTYLKAQNVKIPVGRFELEIKIADVDGHESIQTYLCEIHAD